jgi:hypothetical protein
MADEFLFRHVSDGQKLPLAGTEWSRWIVELLVSKGITLESGMTEAELDTCERKVSFHFPPDLRILLMSALPISTGFPNWRRESKSSILYKLQQPKARLIEAVEAEGLWLPSWGDRSGSPPDAMMFAAAKITAYPELVPIYEHRYIPCFPLEAGNPVFSVCGSDVIVYGPNLLDYFKNEFGSGAFITGVPRPIPGWSEVIDENLRKN